jgi:hypothetical protein
LNGKYYVHGSSEESKEGSRESKGSKNIIKVEKMLLLPKITRKEKKNQSPTDLTLANY